MLVCIISQVGMLLLHEIILTKPKIGLAVKVEYLILGPACRPLFFSKYPPYPINGAPWWLADKHVSGKLD